MSLSRSSITDYPEHLNPFYEGDEKRKFWKTRKVKRSRSFGESIRNVLSFRSIRGKKDAISSPSRSPELQKSEKDVDVLHRRTLPAPILFYSSTPMPLPRSRFSERVAKSTTISNILNEAVHSNPFKEDIDIEAEIDNKIGRKKKRKAPLPPNLEGVHDNLCASSTQNSSKWSLSSEVTDISEHSESAYIVSSGFSSSINNIIKEIEKLTEDENTGDSTRQHDKSVVIANRPSSFGDDQKEQFTNDSDKSTDENFNMLSKICDKEIEIQLIDTELHNIDRKDDLEYRIVEGNEQVLIEEKDILTNLTDSTDIENDILLNENDKLSEADSLTNLINSISMIENECYSPLSHIKEKSESKVDIILEENLDGTCDNENTHLNQSVEGLTSRNEIKNATEELNTDIVVK
ncbi:hypothetical protein FQA39_LY13467 [Lamprigera yunnana]|nr:hypothetical protein FQA39_LY13467 [Lamprigera yunnana]